jgi:hypothetical protein
MAKFNKKTASVAGKKSKRGISLKTSLRKFFEKEVKKNGKITPEKFMQAGVLHGMKGNAQMFKLVYEIMEGKITDKVELTGSMDNKLEIIKKVIK